MGRGPAQMCPFVCASFHIFKHVYPGDQQSNLILFLFAITAAGVVPCDGPKKYPRTSSIVQVIFRFGLLRPAMIF